MFNSSPTFLSPANKAVPAKILPAPPKVLVILFILVKIPLSPFTIFVSDSEFAIFSIVSVQVLESLFNEPSRLFAVFSHNIQYHSQYGISC